MTRNLVFCTDGTWNKPDQQDRDRVVPSNVAKVCRAVSGKTNNDVEQLVYYDTGVGTEGNLFDRIMGGAFGVGLFENVKQAYKVLAKNYQEEDKLFIFGFSRGAYTARSLASLIGLCGIPDPNKNDVDETIKLAYKIYRMNPKKKKSEREKTAKKHVEEYTHINKEVWFIGVWDTVGSLGIPLKLFNWIARSKHRFHDTTLGSHIKRAYHAIAIDERRKPFLPTLWLTENISPEQTVEQVWFPGVHSNVGGGYVDAGLSDRALLWMCLKARDAGLGFNEAYINRRVDPNYHGEVRNSMNILYKIFGPAPREIGIKNGKYAGEMIHYTAERRFEHATEILYRNRYSKESLGKALKNDYPPIAKMDEETGFYSGAKIKWNGNTELPKSMD